MLLRRIITRVKIISLMLKSLKKIFRYGGYTTVNIAKINYGEVLKGKKVLITGGSSGIGLAIAKKCLSEGAVVVITGRNIEKLNNVINEISHSNLIPMVWDISQVSSIEKYTCDAEKLLGGNIDILVNNAGIVDGVTFPDVQEETWDRIYSTNSKGLFFLTQAICKKWLNQNTTDVKKVINISSQGGFVGATYPYRMTKWDLAGLTQGLGIKLAPHGIIVNGIAPGITATDALPTILNRKDNVFSDVTPLERFSLPEEIAELAIFMMSDATNFIVGQTIVCDGGYSIK